MNALEQYIVEIHEVKPYTADWTKEFPNTEFVEVDLTTDCYGNKKRGKHVFGTKEWEKFKNQGYYMA